MKWFITALLLTAAITTADAKDTLKRTGMVSYQKFLADLKETTKMGNKQISTLLNDDGAPMGKYIRAMAYYLYYSNTEAAREVLDGVDVAALNLPRPLQYWYAEFALAAEQYKQLQDIFPSRACAVMPDAESKRKCYYYRSVAEYRVTGIIPDAFAYIRNHYENIDAIMAKEDGDA